MLLAVTPPPARDEARHRQVHRAHRSELLLEYKGYIGEVLYDDEAEVLHVRVVDSGPYPIANAEATDVEGLKREFRCSIDVYLEGCKELGIDRVAPTAVPLEA